MTNLPETEPTFIVTKANEWLGHQYPDKANVEEINFRGDVLEGLLIIADYPRLTNISLSNSCLTHLIITNCQQLTHLNLANNPQMKGDLFWLDQCPNLVHLDISNSNLEIREPLPQLVRLQHCYCDKKQIKVNFLQPKHFADCNSHSNFLFQQWKYDYSTETEIAYQRNQYNKSLANYWTIIVVILLMILPSWTKFITTTKSNNDKSDLVTSLDKLETFQSIK